MSNTQNEIERCLHPACSPRPRPEDFGYEEMDGFGEHGQGGWQFEGGEEAYDAAIAAWEKANSVDR